MWWSRSSKNCYSLLWFSSIVIIFLNNCSCGFFQHDVSWKQSNFERPFHWKMSYLIPASISSESKSSKKCPYLWFVSIIELILRCEHRFQHFHQRAGLKLYTSSGRLDSRIIFSNPGTKIKVVQKLKVVHSKLIFFDIPTHIPPYLKGSFLLSISHLNILLTSMLASTWW